MIVEVEFDFDETFKFHQWYLDEGDEWTTFLLLLLIHDSTNNGVRRTVEGGYAHNGLGSQWRGTDSSDCKGPTPQAAPTFPDISPPFPTHFPTFPDNS